MPIDKQESELTTRRMRIDPHLAAAGWQIVPFREGDSLAKEMAAEARGRFAAFEIHEGDVGKYASTLASALKRDFTAEMKRLRDTAFQDLLENYARRSNVYCKAIENQDQVSSEYLVRAGAGNEYKPADYLELFAQFVRDNADQIDALSILLKKPKGWNTATLVELKAKLTAAPGAFTVDKLQKAHEAHYKKALVDIISMVKHAAKDGEPLLTAAERVQRAVTVLSAGRSFTTNQQAWLDSIGASMTENMSGDREDFDVVPVLAHAGGWTAANRVFAGELAELLGRLNEAIAA